MISLEVHAATQQLVIILFPTPAQESEDVHATMVMFAGFTDWGVIGSGSALAAAAI